MVQPIRTTISFSDKATMIINCEEPHNLSDFVSKAVEGWYSDSKQVLWAEFNANMTKMQQLVPILLPGKEVLVQDKQTE